MVRGSERKCRRTQIHRRHRLSATPRMNSFSLPTSRTLPHGCVAYHPPATYTRRNSRVSLPETPARVGGARMIKLENVTKTFPGGTTAVDDLSLVAPAGQITVLVG